MTDDFTQPGFWLNGRYELRSKTWIQTFRTEMIFTVKTCDDRPQIQVEGRNRAIKSQELTLFRDPQGVWTLEIVITEAVGVTFDALFKFPSARPQARAVDHFLPSAAAANYLRRID